jgi:hypothetical protein
VAETHKVTWHPKAIRRAVERVSAAVMSKDTDLDVSWMDLACLVDAGRAVLDDTEATEQADTMASTTSKCGTYAAYQRHYKQGEKPCDACVHAHAVYQGQWRIRAGRTKNALVPYELLGALLAAAPTKLEEMAERRLGDAVVTRAIEAAEGAP